MRIHFYGFRVSFPHVVTTPDFFAYLSDITDDIQFRGIGRILRVKRKGKYSKGVLFTVRNQRTFMELNRGATDHSVNLRTVGKDGLLEFNFFSFNHETGQGLYQQYHHSLGILAFGAFLRSQYVKFRHTLVQADPKAKKKPPRGLIFQPLVKAQDFPTLVKELAEITSMKLSVATIKEAGSLFNPLSGLTNHTVTTVTFNKSPLKRIASAINALVSSDGVSDVVVNGKDTDGEEQIVRFVGNLSKYDERDFDSLVGNATIPSFTTFDTHPVSQELQRLMVEHDV